MSRILPALAAASLAASPAISFAQSIAERSTASSGATVVAVNDANPTVDENLPPVVVSQPVQRKPKAARTAERPVRAPARSAPAPTSAENKPASEVGSSQSGAGLGGRLTGYTVDFGAPVTAGKDNTPPVAGAGQRSGRATPGDG